MGCSNAILDKFCSSLYKLYILLCGVFFLLPLTVIVLEHHCYIFSVYVWLTINLGLNHPLTKVFFKLCLQVGVAICIIISTCQFFDSWAQWDYWLLFAHYRYSRNLQECFCPFVILRMLKFWLFEVFFDQLSHWHLLFCVEINITGQVVDCFRCMKVMHMQNACFHNIWKTISFFSHIFKIVCFVPIVFTSRTSCFLFFLLYHKKN